MAINVLSISGTNATPESVGLGLDLFEPSSDIRRIMIVSFDYLS